MSTATPTLARATPDRPSPRADAADAAAAAREPATRGPLWAICGVALVVRLLAIVGLRAWTNPNAMEHRSIARFLVEGHGFQFIDWGVLQNTSVQSPPFPFLLAAAFKVFGADAPAAFAAVMFLNAIAGAATCAVLFHAVRAVGGSARVALVAAALLAVWPTQVYATAVVQAITLITLCTASLVLLFYRSVDARSAGPWVAYGLVGCLAALTEPVLLPFMALSGLLILLWPALPGRVRLRNAAILLGCATLVLAPWTIRNVLVHGKVVPVKSTFWVNMWKGNNPNASGTDRPVLSEAQREAIVRGDSLADASVDAVRQYDLLSADERAQLEGKTEVEREVVFAGFAKTFIREHPGRYVELCGKRLWKTLWVEADSPKAHGARQYALYWTPRTVLLIATPIGLWMAWRRRWRLAVPALIAGLALLTHTLTIAAARFAFPYEPFQIALLALIAVSVYERGQERRPKEATI